MLDLKEKLGLESSSEASEIAQKAIDGIVDQTLTNLGTTRTPALEERFWKLDRGLRASLANRLLLRDKSVYKDIKKALKL